MPNPPRFRNNDGTLTAYAFACGYVETFTEDGRDYYLTDAPGVMLAKEGVYHVKAHTNPHGGPGAIWESFETLTEARKAFRHYKAGIKRGVPVQDIYDAR